MKTCLHCQAELIQRPTQSTRDYSKQQFCSKSCANLSNPRRKPTGSCLDCNKPIRIAWKRCTACHQKLFPDPRKMTLGEVKARFTTPGDKYGICWRRRLSDYARCHLDLPKQCQVCGYDKHVEICHIRSKVDFPDTALVEEVNSPNNVISLCPNCHWEFDHGFLKL